MLPKELAVAEAWVLAMLFVERARAFMIFPTFVLITSRSALKSAFQVVAANPNPHPHAAGRSPPDAGGKLQRAFHTKSLPARVRNGRGRLSPRTRDGRLRTRTASAPRRASASERWRAPRRSPTPMVSIAPTQPG